MPLPTKKVIYTVITGKYDLLFPPVVNQPGWDHICYTDDETLASDFWQVRPLPQLPELAGLDDARRARIVKILPHRFLQEYEYSVYLDANRTLTDSLADYIKAHDAPDILCLASRAPDAYGAVKELLSGGRDKDPFALAPRAAVSKEEKKLLKGQARQWKAAGLPGGGGCPGTWLLARRHMDVADTMEKWAGLVLSGSGFDELSFPLACHLTGQTWTEGLPQTPAPNELFSPAEQLLPALPHAGGVADAGALPVPEYPENPPPPGGEYGGWPLLLSICVPVSNQGATMERCLAGVKPILDALPAELVVMDTGSSDKTIPIAKSFGARVVDFPWVEDMSAARNAGVRAARGLWYMSIDADEWFEDPAHIIDFFQSGRYKNYTAASYVQRNYRDKSMAVWRDNPSARMAQKTPGLHFEGRIHDMLTGYAPGKSIHLPAAAHHLGFAKDSLLKSTNKKLRNLVLLKLDMVQYPGTLRFAFQMLHELAGLSRNMDAIRVGWWILSLERQYPDKHMRNMTASHMANALFCARAFPELLRFCARFVKPEELNYVDAATVYYVQAAAHAFAGQQKAAEGCFARYTAIRNKYLALPEDKQQLQWATLGADLVNEQSYQELKALVKSRK